MEPAPQSLLEPVRAIARAASDAILEVYAEDFAVTLKDDRTPLTAAISIRASPDNRPAASRARTKKSRASTFAKICAAFSAAVREKRHAPSKRCA